MRRGRYPIDQRGGSFRGASDRKLGKGVVNYHMAIDEDRCGVCKAFMSPHGCKKVEGRVAKDGWCRVGVSKEDDHAFSE